MASTTTLGCFKCSELAPGHPCPNSNNDPTSWKTDANKYSESQVDLPLTTSSETCSVIVGKSGRIYHQGFVSKRKCTEQAYITRLAINIGRKFQDPSSQMKCCDTSGCNWSWDSAAKNQGLVSATDSDSSLLIGFIGVISLGLILLLGCLLCCFIFFWRKKNEDSKDEMLYFPRSTYTAQHNMRQQDTGGESSGGGLSMYDRGQLSTNRYTEVKTTTNSTKGITSTQIFKMWITWCWFRSSEEEVVQAVLP